MHGNSGWYLYHNQIKSHKFPSQIQMEIFTAITEKNMFHFPGKTEFLLSFQILIIWKRKWKKKSSIGIM